MFDESADLYDAFYDAAGKDYQREATRLVEIIRPRLPDARTLLDVACGTGRHIEALSEAFECAGADLNPKLLEIARRRCPSTPFSEADMVSFDLGGQFDVVTCLFSSIGYVVSRERLAAAVERMAAHIVPGGLLVIEPWILRDAWAPGDAQVLTADSHRGPAVRMMRSVSIDDPAVSVLEAHYLVGTPTGIEHTVERHELGLFAREDYTSSMESAGLDVEWDEPGLCGRGILLGRTPLP